MHLTNNFAYLLMVVLSLMMPFVVRIRSLHHWNVSLWVDALMFVSATLSIASFYMLAQREARHESFWKRFVYLFPVMSLGIGLCINNTKAVFEALTGYKSGIFVRTPKYGVVKSDQSYAHVKYKFKKNLQSWIETGIGLYYVWGIVDAIIGGAYQSVPFLMLFGFGFLYVGLASLLQRSGLASKIGLRRASAATTVLPR